MPSVFRRSLLSVACLALAVGCVGEGASHQTTADVEPVARRPQPPAVTTAPTRTEAAAPPEAIGSIKPIERPEASVPTTPVDHLESIGNDGEQDIVTTAAGKPAYRLRYKFRPDRPLYYVIENEFLDHGGVPSLLTFTTRANDRRTLIQRMASVQTAPKRSPLRSTAKGLTVRLTWECDRYEVREKGMKAEVKFDSLRDLYPRVALRKLGGIPGSQVTFTYNRASRAFGNPRVVRGKSAGPPTHKKLSRTARKCDLNNENLASLFDDLSALFLPSEPKPVGETWSARRTSAVKNYGQSVTDYVFTLNEVRRQDGRQIALIDVAGEVHLERADTGKPNRPGAKSAPARGPKSKKKNKHRDFKIDRAVCTGSIEFDVTRGELINLVLRRQLDLTAELESKDAQKVALETGSSHVLRVEVRDIPPAKPIIVGGPKAPPPEPIAASKRGGARRGTTAAKRRGPATRPTARKKPPSTAGKRSVKPRARPVKKPARSTSTVVGPPNQRGKKSAGVSKETVERQGKSRPGIGRGRRPVRPTTQPASRPASG